MAISTPVYVGSNYGFDGHTSPSTSTSGPSTPMVATVTAIPRGAIIVVAVGDTNQDGTHIGGVVTDNQGNVYTSQGTQQGVWNYVNGGETVGLTFFTATAGVTSPTTVTYTSNGVNPGTWVSEAYIGVAYVRSAQSSFDQTSINAYGSGGSVHIGSSFPLSSIPSANSEVFFMITWQEANPNTIPIADYATYSETWNLIDGEVDSNAVAHISWGFQFQYRIAPAKGVTDSFTVSWTNTAGQTDSIGTAAIGGLFALSPIIPRSAFM